ncbi:MAG TPA: MBL fold metallo-hydrolase [Abditibacteriaceae bacterium]|nr:MBL fold metallo-hydrolase [Abditibacteriaceae bacterium]
MLVRFHGVRGSCPAPASSDDLAARLVEAIWQLGHQKDTPDLTDRAAIARWVAGLPPAVGGTAGGNTACVEMRTAAGDLFIIDCGSGLRNLGNELMNSEFGQGQGHACIFLSHFHWDHIQGWPFFKPAYISGNRLEVYTRHHHLESRLRQQQKAPFFPPASWDDMRADISFHEIDDKPLVLGKGRVRVTSLELDHPSRAYAYRFEADGKVFVYASDGAYYKLDDVAIRPYVEFYRDADLLIFDAQFTLTESFDKHSWGHSSAIIGVELACQASVKKLVLFHHDPDADEATLEHLLRVGEEYAAIVPAAIRRSPDQVRLMLAREGMVIEL